MKNQIFLDVTSEQFFFVPAPLEALFSLKYPNSARIEVQSAGHAGGQAMCKTENGIFDLITFHP
jgi:hypothetical protein